MDAPVGSRQTDPNAATISRIEEPPVKGDRSVRVDVGAPTMPATPPGGVLALAATTPGALSIDEEAPEVPPGILERYDRLELLGEGGMGTVWKAHDRRLGRRVALKFLRGADPDIGRRFLQEARAQARLDHANVCRVYEAGVADGRRYIAMQYIDGDPLDRAKQRMTLEQKVKAIREVAAALHEAHRLGLIHRDIKPGNIMIERAEDGSLKPYIMDFGLAREIDERGHTMTGVVMGTPAFMAPEQARGDIRSLDRRTDVYSLGATLYDLLAARPPFVDATPWKIIYRVAQEDPEPIRTVNKCVPEDLAKVVMKCLEKEPHRRYESAKALGDDLQRFLDGEPVQARNASLGYVLAKKVRKNKLAVLLVGVLFAGTCAPGAVWVGARQEAAEQARLAQALGEDMKEMELFMRAAYGLPLHDVERERAIVRERLRDVEETMALAGPAGEGPGHYALGRGYLALHEYELAHEHLTLAIQAGYASPELYLAAGRALGELYKKGIERARRINDEEQRDAQIRELDAELRERALSHLRRGGASHGGNDAQNGDGPRGRPERGRGARLDAPEYVEALIAFYSGNPEEARRLAREAFEKSPLLYEAKKLEGDILFEEGSKARVDSAFDYERAVTRFKLAEEAYRSASSIGRSDPAIYEAECELGEHAVMLMGAAGVAAKEHFEAALDACGKAIAASPERAVGYTKLAAVRVAWAYDSVGYMQGEPEEDIKRAIEAAEEAVRRGPSDAVASYYLGAALLSRAMFEERAGRSTSSSLDLAVRAYERSLALDPTYVWATRELGMAYEARARSDMARGVSADEALASSVKYLRRAYELDPGLGLTQESIASVYRVMAEHHMQIGQDPAPAFESALDAQRTHKLIVPNFFSVYEGFAETYLLMASRELDVGGDPRALLEGAMRNIQESMGRNPKSRQSAVELARAQTLRARDAIRRGEDPTPMLVEAREAARRAAAQSPWYVEPGLLLSRVELIAARLAMQRGASRKAVIERLAGAEEALHPRLSDERTEDPRVYREMAEVYAARAALRASGGEDPAAEIAQGHSMAEAALAKNPRMAAALVVRSALDSIAARAARDPAARRAAELRANEWLEAAARVSPLGRPYVEALLAEVGVGSLVPERAPERAPAREEIAPPRGGFE